MSKSKKKGHNDPGCIACTDPVKAAEQRMIMRERIGKAAERAREHRAEGERIREEEYRTAESGSAEFADAQARMLHHLGTANALAQRAMIERGQMERIEDAHNVSEAGDAELLEAQKRLSA